MRTNQPKDGIQERVGEDVKVVYTFDDWDTEKAARLAKKADVAIVFANADSGEEYITLEGNNDRRNLTLWNNGDNLVSNSSSVSCFPSSSLLHNDRFEL